MKFYLIIFSADEAIGNNLSHRKHTKNKGTQLPIIGKGAFEWKR